HNLSAERFDRKLVPRIDPRGVLRVRAAANFEFAFRVPDNLERRSVPQDFDFDFLRSLLEDLPLVHRGRGAPAVQRVIERASLNRGPARVRRVGHDGNVEEVYVGQRPDDFSASAFDLRAAFVYRESERALVHVSAFNRGIEVSMQALVFIELAEEAKSGRRVREDESPRTYSAKNFIGRMVEQALHVLLLFERSLESSGRDALREASEVSRVRVVRGRRASDFEARLVLHTSQARGKRTSLDSCHLIFPWGRGALEFAQSAGIHAARAVSLLANLSGKCTAKVCKRLDPLRLREPRFVLGGQTLRSLTEPRSSLDF